MAKRFINIVIDSLNPAVFADCLYQNKIPALKFLVDHGRITLDCISAFPTMTPVAAASIATGTLVDQHHLPGFIWYDSLNKRKINYGATKKAVFKLGVYQVIEDFLFRMNEKHLNQRVSTIFETLEEQGITSGAINFFCFRGLREYQVKFPLSLFIASGFRLKGHIFGPRQLILGKIVNNDQSLVSLLWQKKFGFNDFFSYRAAINLLQTNQAPDFLMIYFPDNDSYSHLHGPKNTAASIMQVDKYIGQLLSFFGTWDQAITENVFLVLGDHSQSQVLANELALINLEKIMADLKDKIIVCPNERMAYLHCFNLNQDEIKTFISSIAKDRRIGIISWREGSKFYASTGGSKKKVIFSLGNQVIDEAGISWNFCGDLEVVDGRTAWGTNGEKIFFGDYPAAFQRLASVLNYMPEQTLVLSARPGYEFYCSDAPTHLGGGSHGSLHKNDSLVPLIIAGSSLWPEFASITSLKKLWCAHFQI